MTVDILRPFGSKNFHGFGIRFETGTADEIYAVGDRGENGFEVFTNGFGATGEIHNERATANASGLPRENRGGHILQGGRAHLFAESGEHFRTHRGGRFWCDVAYCRAGASGRHDQAALIFIGHLLHRRFEFGLIVGHDFVGDFEWRGEPFAQEGHAGLARGVFVDTRAGSIRYIQDTDGNAHNRSPNLLMISSGVTPCSRKVRRLRESCRLARRSP